MCDLTHTDVSRLMHATTPNKPWDFSHVLDLVNSLANQPASTTEEDDAARGKQKENRGHHPVKEPTSNNKIEERDFAIQAHNLGDFSRIYQYLGTPLRSPTPKVPAADVEHEVTSIAEFTSKDDYASDGATYIKRVLDTPKAVQWRDQASAEETATDAASDTSTLPESPTLSKAQRKKRNRRAREREAAEAASRALKAATVSESEADVGARNLKTPAKKASAHVGTLTPWAKQVLQTRNSSGKTLLEAAAEDDPIAKGAQAAVMRLDAARKASAEAGPSKARAAFPTMPPVNQNLTRNNFQPNPILPAPNGNTINASIPTGKQPQAPFTTPPRGPRNTHFLPSTVQPPAKTTAPPVLTPGKPATVQKPAPSKARVIEPKIIRSGEDRHWALLMKLLADFYRDRSYLINPMNLTTHNNNPTGIHVFVDASNIFIGFNDQLKRSRGIGQHVQIPQVDLSFDALALLMERRRPVAKRVLVGSTPHLAAFDKAKAVGYECSILEKVYKARELTERQIYFQEKDRLNGRGRRAKAPPANHPATLNGPPGGGNGSGSETTTPQYAPARMIEQGVDEILHLKMLESVVDAEAPSTIVLATGDAALAEYSQGFMAMAERALKKGWMVELVSWSHNINAGYTRDAWTQAWGERFKIVYLDDYAEELLDM